jgi:pilus assembly protein Flp/PilA
MKMFISRMQKFGSREEGATMVEYGLMVALIAVVCLVAVGLLGDNVAGVFDQVATEVGSAGGGAE